MTDFCHCSVHIDDVSLLFLGLARETAGLVDVVAHRLALHIAHRVRIKHFTVDFHRGFKLRNENSVALAQHDVFRAARVGNGFVEFDTDGIGVADLVFFQLF